MPDRLILPYPERNITSDLPSYTVLRDGAVVLQGAFPSDLVRRQDGRFPSPLEDPLDYLADLKSRAEALVRRACPASGKVTMCETRMLGPDMVEWMISWAANDVGEIVAIELLHERRFSGVGGTWNIVFTN